MVVASSIMKQFIRLKQCSTILSLIFQPYSTFLMANENFKHSLTVEMVQVKQHNGDYDTFEKHWRLFRRHNELSSDVKQQKIEVTNTTTTPTSFHEHKYA